MFVMLKEHLWEKEIQHTLIDEKKWIEAYKIGKEAHISFPENRKIAIRIAGCCFYLNKVDEGLYILNPSTINNSEQALFSSLFPNFRKLLIDSLI